MKSRASSGTGEGFAPEQVAAALQALPDLDRVVLALQLLDGLTPLEVAGALRVTTLEVEKRTATAMRVLSRELGVRPALRRAA